MWDDVQYVGLGLVVSVGQNQPGLSSGEMIDSSCAPRATTVVGGDRRGEGKGSRLESRDSLSRDGPLLSEANHRRRNF